MLPRVQQLQKRRDAAACIRLQPLAQQLLRALPHQRLPVSKAPAEQRRPLVRSALSAHLFSRGSALRALATLLFCFVPWQSIFKCREAMPT